MSIVSLCNQALVLIGDQTITDLTDDNDRARTANLFYSPTRDAVLRAHPWAFAKKRVALVREVAVPTFKWKYQFILPTDPLCLRVLEIDEDVPGYIPWVVEGGKFLCNETTAKILYTAQITDTTLFDSLFTDALAARLAVAFGVALTKQKTLVDLAEKIYEVKIQEAKSIDSMEGTQPSIYSPDLLNVR